MSAYGTKPIYALSEYLTLQLNMVHRNRNLDLLVSRKLFVIQLVECYVQN